MAEQQQDDVSDQADAAAAELEQHEGDDQADDGERTADDEFASAVDALTATADKLIANMCTLAGLAAVTFAEWGSLMNFEPGKTAAMLSLRGKGASSAKKHVMTPK